MVIKLCLKIKKAEDNCLNRRFNIKTANNNQIVFDVDDNSIAIPLFGERDKNIKYIEKSLNLKINARGNILFIPRRRSKKSKKYFIKFNRRY